MTTTQTTAIAQKNAYYKNSNGDPVIVLIGQEIDLTYTLLATAPKDSFFTNESNQIVKVNQGQSIDPSYDLILPQYAQKRSFYTKPDNSIIVVDILQEIDPRNTLITPAIAPVNTVFNSQDGCVEVVYAGQEIDPRYTPWTPPVPTAQQIAEQNAQTIALLESAVQSYIDKVAQAKGYDSASRCITYINSTNATWKSEATAMNAWRDAVWMYCANLLQTAQTVPTEAELIAELPAAPW